MVSQPTGSVRDLESHAIPYFLARTPESLLPEENALRLPPQLAAVRARSARARILWLSLVDGEPLDLEPLDRDARGALLRHLLPLDLPHTVIVRVSHHNRPLNVHRHLRRRAGRGIRRR